MDTSPWDVKDVLANPASSSSEGKTRRLRRLRVNLTQLPGAKLQFVDTTKPNGEDAERRKGKLSFFGRRGKP